VELTVTVHAEQDGYWSEIRELPGCFASARTLDELREALGEAVGLYLWDRPASLEDQVVRVGDVEIEVAPPGSD
jgi:predicted RNase H-like HicB family nuclease